MVKRVHRGKRGLVYRRGRLVPLYRYFPYLLLGRLVQRWTELLLMVQQSQRARLVRERSKELLMDRRARPVQLDLQNRLDLVVRYPL